MGHDLTKQYSGFFDRKGVKKIFSLAKDIYKFGKFRELVSFTVWEAYHRLGLFPKKSYLSFNNANAIALENEKLATLEFDEKANQFFGSRGLRATRCEHNWKQIYINSNGEVFGSLYPDDCDLYKSMDGGKTVEFVYKFPESIKSLFISSLNTIFVCVEGSMYRGSDKDKSFTKVLDLGSPISFFRSNNAMTETPSGELWAGEYGNILEKNGWRKLAYLYHSADDGETWQVSDFLIQKGINKHVHIVKYSKLLNRLMVADGDNYKKLWISGPLDAFDFKNPNWIPITKYHIQMGGYTAVVENDEKVFFGTDYQGGTNFIVETTDAKNFTKKVVPDPYRRSPIDNMVMRKAKKGYEMWANLPFSAPGTRCLLMYSNDGGSSWNKVFDYSRSTHAVWIISSSRETADTIYISVQNQKTNARVVYQLVDA
jgi:hypothetical protein